LTNSGIDVPPTAKTPPPKRATAQTPAKAPKVTAAGRSRIPPVPPAAEPPEKLSSADQIVGEILRGLYEGRYVAGQKLTESDLTKRFGVGRGSVREALRRLAAEGLVTVSLHRGASIRALTRDDVRDVLEVIEALAGLSARLAAERLSRPEDERALRDTLQSLSALANAGDAFQFARMRNRFYRQLAHISGNRELARLVPMVQAHLVRVQFRAAYGIQLEKQRVGDYEKAIEAVLARDGAKAERAMRQHIRNTARAIELLPDQNFAH
jgi:DNA-binding GntR family transcriptional regulator